MIVTTNRFRSSSGGEFAVPPVRCGNARESWNYGYLLLLSCRELRHVRK